MAEAQPSFEGTVEPIVAEATKDLPFDEERLQNLLEIPVQICVEVGRAKLLVGDLLGLHKGSVIELTKLSSEALDVTLNGQKIARGEPVVINGRYGMRFTELVDQTDRIRSLRSEK